jgi:hypothetical protein
MVMGAKAEPRVSASQVVPSPTKAATANASKNPKSNRTFDPMGRGKEPEEYALADLPLNCRECG